jgi:hypothetical protein
VRIFIWQSLVLLALCVSASSPALEQSPGTCSPREWASLSPARGNISDLAEFLRPNFSIFSRISSEDKLHFRKLTRLAFGNPERPGLFFDVELAVLKELNDIVFPESKGLVTALANAYKEMFFQELQRSPLLRAELRGQYSDFKSLRFAFQNDSPEARKELARVYASTSRRFSEYLNSFGMQERLARQRGLAGDPHSWHLSGIGSDPDQANIAARLARSRFTTGATPMQDFRDVRPELAALATRSVRLEQDIARTMSMRFPQLFQKATTSGQSMELNPGAVEILLKTRPRSRSLLGFYVALYQRFLDRFGVRLSPTDLELLVEWKRSVDTFQPGIHVESHNPIQLEGSSHGVLFIDIAGQNVRNFMHTAGALRRNATNSADEAIALARDGEHKATAELDRRRHFLVARLDENYGANRGRRFDSGDDAAYVPSQNHSRLARVRFYREIAASDFAGDLRWTWVEPRFSDTREVVPPEVLESLGGFGEAFEKDLRRALEPDFIHSGYARLRQIFMSVEVEGRQSAPANLIVYIGASSAHFRSNIEARARILARDMGAASVVVRVLP